MLCSNPNIWKTDVSWNSFAPRFQEILISWVKLFSDSLLNNAQKCPCMSSCKVHRQVGVSLSHALERNDVSIVIPSDPASINFLCRVRFHLWWEKVLTVPDMTRWKHRFIKILSLEDEAYKCLSTAPQSSRTAAWFQELWVLRISLQTPVKRNQS